MMKGCILGCRYVEGCARGGRRRIVEDLANNGPPEVVEARHEFSCLEGRLDGGGEEESHALVTDGVLDGTTRS